MRRYRPSPATSAPDEMVVHRYATSGVNALPASNTVTPSNTTDAVCITETAAPTATT